MAKFAVILPAAGRAAASRTTTTRSRSCRLAGRAVWLHSAERFLQRKDVMQVLVVIAPEDREDFNFKFGSNVAILGIDVVPGGAERFDSVAAALARVKPEADFVCIHDAARPCLADAWIDEVFRAAERSGAAILAIPVASTLKRVGPRSEDRRDGSPRRALGGPDAAGLSPPVAHGCPCPAGRFSGHR